MNAHEALQALLDGKVLRKGYFTILREDWKPKDEPMFGDIPKGLLEAM